MKRGIRVFIVTVVFLFVISLGCQGVCLASAENVNSIEGNELAESEQQTRSGNFTVSTAYTLWIDGWNPAQMVNTANNYGAIDNQDLLYARGDSSNPMGKEKYRVEVRNALHSYLGTLSPTNQLGVTSGLTTYYTNMVYVTFNKNISLPYSCHYTDDTIKMKNLTKTLKHNSSAKVGHGRVLYRVKPVGGNYSSWQSCDLDPNSDSGDVYARQILVNAAGIIEFVVIYEVADTYGGTSYHRFKAIYTFKLV